MAFLLLGMLYPSAVVWLPLVAHHGPVTALCTLPVGSHHWQDLNLVNYRPLSRLKAAGRQGLCLILHHSIANMKHQEYRPLTLVK